MNVLLKYKLINGINWENHDFIKVSELPEMNQVKMLSEYQDCEEDKALKIKEIRKVNDYVDNKKLLNENDFYKIICRDKDNNVVKLFIYKEK